MHDHYALLGISPAATVDVVKTAYRRLATQLHPDKNPSPDAADRFRLIQKAYEVLSDSDRRRAYDDLRQRSLIETPLLVAKEISQRYIKAVLN
jgi:curved DNA-binding protein CbpA